MKIFIFIAFVLFCFQKKPPVQSLSVADLFRLRNGEGRGRTPGPSWASVPTLREQGPARPARSTLAVTS